STPRAAKKARTAARISARRRRLASGALGRQLMSSGLFLDPGNVLAGASIDLEQLALLDEQRHAHHGAGLEGGRLAATAGGVAAQAGIGLHHLERDEVRRHYRQRLAVPQRDGAQVLLADPLERVLDGG